jgi:hypothetical protein
MTVLRRIEHGLEMLGSQDTNSLMTSCLGSWSVIATENPQSRYFIDFKKIRINNHRIVMQKDDQKIICTVLYNQEIVSFDILLWLNLKGLIDRNDDMTRLGKNILRFEIIDAETIKMILTRSISKLNTQTWQEEFTVSPITYVYTLQKDTAAAEYSSIDTRGKLRQDTSMLEYTLNLRNIEHTEQQGAIQDEIGDTDATLFYDHNKKIGVIVCGPGAYYCDCTLDVEAFIACQSSNSITIHKADLMWNDILYLTSMDNDGTECDLKIQLEKPYH